MSAGLIKHLKRKTEEDSNTRILMSQWEFDEKLVGKSLENVGSYYPHFSSHNESHSQQILVNIERLLGSNIEKLTATDTWLILEAAYWHDIGMLFNADEVQKVFEEDDFKEYVESLANDNTQDLHEFAKVWHEDGWNKALVNHSDPHTGVEKYRQMIAEWYRRGHAKNSNSVVLDPFEKLGISSPRTELLPKRIYRYLGQICWAHGLGFDDYVMKTLPFRQTGMGTENCHPRFVACLLRLGDLFDIDDNRFCPVMARQVGNMPSFSETHKHKHQAIREFQLDNETVSITAICSTEMAYIECRNWFDWIREEIQNQMSQWKNIVPSRDFGLLPTINKLNVEMDNSKILLDDKPMKFSLDERSAIELLQGNNLYKDDMSIYRELIQNAIDATMIRVWLEHGQEHSTRKLPQNANPYDKDTRELFADYPITLDYKKVDNNKDSTLWEFSIEDNGAGISRTDLEYMQKIAGSKNNKEKQKIIRQMPEWMRPSGEFGIGMHSAFLLMKDLPTNQQKITILTKSRLTHESLKVELNSPLSGKTGYCFIEKIEDKGSYGTKILLNQRIQNNEESSEKYENLSSLLRQHTLHKYSNGSFDILLKMISIYKKVSTPLFEINFNPEIHSIFDKIPITKNKYDMFYWNREQSSGLSLLVLDYDDTVNSNGSTSSIKFSIDIYYRGQYVCDLSFEHLNDTTVKYIHYDFISFKLDIYKNTAKNLLNLNRERLKDENKISIIFNDVFSDLMTQAQINSCILSELFDKNYKHSLFTKLIDTEQGTNLNSNDEWRKFKISNELNIEQLNTIDTFIINNRHSDQPLPENTLNIDSNVLESLVETNFMKKILEENKFKTYFNRRVRSYKWTNIQNILFSKQNISNDHWEDFNFYDELSGQKELTLENLYHFNLLYMKIDSFEPNIFIKYSRINSNTFPASIKKEIESILVDFDNEKFIAYPFIVHNNKIITIKNEILYRILNNLIFIEFDKFDIIYNKLKEYIVEQSKVISIEWYQSYANGKDFKPLDLTILDKLYKSSTYLT